MLVIFSSPPLGVVSKEYIELFEDVVIDVDETAVVILILSLRRGVCEEVS